MQMEQAEGLAVIALCVELIQGVCICAPHTVSKQQPQQLASQQHTKAASAKQKTFPM